MYGIEGTQLIAVPRATERATTDKWLAGCRVAAIVSGSFVASSNGRGASFGGTGWRIDPGAKCSRPRRRMHHSPRSMQTIGLSTGRSSLIRDLYTAILGQSVTRVDMAAPTANPSGRQATVG
jgi:hypothetical protein